MSYEMSHRGPHADDVLDWDEARDPAQVRKRPVFVPALGRKERRLLEALADGTWLSENLLRKALGWGRLQFFFVTTRAVLAGRVEARPESSIFTSEYRLSPEVWR